MIKIDYFLSPDEISEGIKREETVAWSKCDTCSVCGDRMFYFPSWEKLLCRSWLYMEGGCKFYTEPEE